MDNWIKTTDHTPELPDENYCHVMVLASNQYNKYAFPMYYERTMIRGKRVERWKYHNDRICEDPEYWMPMPLAKR